MESLHCSPLADSAPFDPVAKDPEVIAPEFVTTTEIVLPLGALPRLGFSVITPLAVDIVGHWFEMRWTDAGAMTTEMVKFGPFRDGPNQFFVSVPVREDISLFPAARRTETSIPIALLEATPEPATISPFDLRPEAMLRKSHSMSVTHMENTDGA